MVIGLVVGAALASADDRDTIRLELEREGEAARALVLCSDSLEQAHEAIQIARRHMRESGACRDDL